MKKIQKKQRKFFICQNSHLINFSIRKNKKNLEVGKNFVPLQKFSQKSSYEIVFAIIQKKIKIEVFRKKKKKMKKKLKKKFFSFFF